MRGKFFFGAGLLIGYIFGTRAGRRRYEQMKAFAQSVWNTAPVQHSVDVARDFALSTTGDVVDTALDAVKKLVRVATSGAMRAETVAEETVAEAMDVVTETAQKAAAKPKPAAKKPATKNTKASL